MSLSFSTHRSVAARIAAKLQPLHVLAVNAGMVAISNLAAAVLGFGYWWIAARQFPPEQVGLAASAVSVMNLLAQIGEFGLGPLLLSEVPKHTRTAGSLIAAALAVTFVCSLLLAIAYVVSIRWVLPHVGAIFETPQGLAIFIGGVVLTGATVVLDQALVALLKSELQAVRLGSFALIKLIFLASVGFLASGSATATAIFATWVAGHLASIVVLGLFSSRRRQTFWRRPRMSLLKPVVGKLIGHHFLNVALQAPILLLPFLVTEMLSARVNAAFYAAWAILGVVSLAPASLSSVVVTVARREPAAFANRFTFSLVVSLAICAMASLTFWFFSPFILGLFNPEYRSIAGSSLAVLGVGTIGMAVKYHYIALARFAERMTWATVAVSVGGFAELLMSAYGASTGGLDGLARGWVIAVSIEALAMAALMGFVAAGWNFARLNVRGAKNPSRMTLVGTIVDAAD